MVYIYYRLDGDPFFRRYPPPHPSWPLGASPSARPEKGAINRSALRRDNQPSWFKSQLQSTLNVHPGLFFYRALYRPSPTACPSRGYGRAGASKRPPRNELSDGAAAVECLGKEWHMPDVCLYLCRAPSSENIQPSGTSVGRYSPSV
jgi:hypothetical protein